MSPFQDGEKKVLMVKKKNAAVGSIFFAASFLSFQARPA
jgi:hypothetical protein